MTTIIKPGAVHRTISFIDSLSGSAESQKTTFLAGAVLVGMGRLFLGGIGAGALLGAQLGRGIAEDLELDGDMRTFVSVSGGIGGAIFGATVPGRALITAAGVGLLIAANVRIALGLTATAALVATEES